MRVVTFVAVTYLLSAALGFGWPLLGGSWSGVAGILVAGVYMWIPAVVAIALQRAWGEPILAPLGVRLSPNRWWLWAWLVPPLLAIGALRRPARPGGRLQHRDGGAARALRRHAPA